MAFASGKFVICAAPDCDSIRLTTVRESWDDQEGIFVGEQRCDVCGTGMLFSRRPNTPQEIVMAKKKQRRPTTKDEPRRQRRAVGHEGGKRVSALRGGRVNTIKGDGAMPESKEILPPAEPSIGEAMRLAVEALGEVVIDDQLAAGQLRELSEAYEHVTEEKAAFDRKNDAAKVAKKAWESATNLLLEKVRAFTHPTPLPLFDQQQREDDEADMLGGGDVDPESESASV